MRQRNYFGTMMVEMGDADGLISGLTQSYPETIRPALQIIGTRQRRAAGLRRLRPDPPGPPVLPRRHHGEHRSHPGGAGRDRPAHRRLRPPLRRRAAGRHALVLELRLEQPSVGAQGAPRDRDRLAASSRSWRSTARCRPTPPSSSASSRRATPGAASRQPANVLIFPELQSANIAYKLIWRLAGAEAIGPILLGMAKPVHVLQNGLEVSDIVNMAALCVVDAQELAGGERYGEVRSPG